MNSAPPYSVASLRFALFALRFTGWISYIIRGQHFKTTTLPGLKVLYPELTRVEGSRDIEWVKI